MPSLYYYLGFGGIAIIAVLVLAVLIFPRRGISAEDPLGYLDEWDPTMGISRRDFFVLQRNDAARAGIDPLSADYPPLRDEHITSDGKPLKFL